MQLVICHMHCTSGSKIVWLPSTCKQKVSMRGFKGIDQNWNWNLIPFQN